MTAVQHLQRPEIMKEAYYKNEACRQHSIRNMPKPTFSVKSICLDPAISRLVFLTYFYFSNNMAGRREVNKRQKQQQRW